jgi:hypothetical protein
MAAMLEDLTNRMKQRIEVDAGNSPSEPASVESERAKWLNRLGGEILKLDELFPQELGVGRLPDEACPAWEEKVSDEIARILMPGAELKGATRFTPKQMGAILGHQCANGVWMVELFAAQAAAALNTGQKSVSGADTERGNAFSEKFSAWYSGLRRLAKRSLCSCVDQPYEVMTDFLGGFAEGFSHKPKTWGIGQFGSTNFEIYVLLMVYHPFIEQLGSVSALHAWLRKVMGEYRTGDLKRIEKICQRIGLHFRKPGRPKMVK